MPEQQTYREALSSALDCLEEAEGHTMSAVLNLALAGTYKELGELFEMGEIFNAEAAMFTGTGDTNIDLILKLVGEINATKDSIRNLNAVG